MADVRLRQSGSLALENARLIEEVVRQDRRRRDLENARRVRDAFLPPAPPSLTGYEVWGFTEPAHTLNGDFYDYVALPGGRLAVLVGDVASKGVAAALLATSFVTACRWCLPGQPDLASAVARLNDTLSEVTLRCDYFLTLSAVVLDPATNSVTLLCAGHAAPLLYRPVIGEPAHALLDALCGPPLGIFDAASIVREGISFDSHTITLGDGDCLVLFTDGVTDAKDAREKVLGPASLRAEIAAAAAAGPRAVVEAIVAAVRRHSAGCQLDDDFTVVALRRTPTKEEPHE